MIKVDTLVRNIIIISYDIPHFFAHRAVWVDTSSLYHFLCRGTTIDIFKASGKVPREKEEFIISARGEEMC
jgi:hypothetical protein